MLLRTTSTPSLRSAPPSSSSSSCPDPSSSWTSLTRSISLTPAAPVTCENRIQWRTSSEERILMRQPNKKLLRAEGYYAFPSLVEETGGACEETSPFMISCSSLVGKGGEVGHVGVLVGGGAGGGGGGGESYGCGGGGGEGQGSERSMDAYYQNMIESYPGDALLLGNYARFLKEVRGDAEKAEEYCERAILAKRSGEPCDASVLSLYGDLIWKTQNDGLRAQSYFDQALQSSPNDCYVLASYAQFLWDAGEEEEEGEEEEDEDEDGEQEEDKTELSKSLASANPNQNLTAA